MLSRSPPARIYAMRTPACESISCQRPIPGRWQARSDRISRCQAKRRSNRNGMRVLSLDKWIELKIASGKRLHVAKIWAMFKSYSIKTFSRICRST